MVEGTGRSAEAGLLLPEAMRIAEMSSVPEVRWSVHGSLFDHYAKQGGIESDSGPVLIAHQSPGFETAPRLRSPFGPPSAGTDASGIARVLDQAQAAGLPYQLRETNAGWRLDLYVPDEFRADASQWLSESSVELPIPPGGWLRLETAPTP